MSLDPLRSIHVTRMGGALHFADDDVVVEEPLDLRVSGETLAVTMRTPDTTGSSCSASSGAKGS